MHLAYDQLPDPTGKFEIIQEISNGVQARVFKAKELDTDRVVAIKIQPYDNDHQVHIEEEYRVLRDYSSHPNIPEFYGVYRQKQQNAPDDIWFIIEYCPGGTAVDMVNKLLQLNQPMREEHIAFLIREVARAAVELNRSHFIHRDIRGSNILLTKNGEVRLCDFGLTREVDSTMGKRGTCIGSPCWMAPEVVSAQDARSREVYTSRADVWALGITAIELADGRPPFFDMHPTRAMFQIVRNPPPTLLKPINWSQTFIDFITECLEKDPENRPMMMEVVEHPFLNELFDNEEAMQQEIKSLLQTAKDAPAYTAPEEVAVESGYIKRFEKKPEKMYTEDLAGIDSPSEQILLETLGNRISYGHSYSFIGDILLSLNSNDIPLTYEQEFHAKYKFKSRSENAPHIFSVADIAYQDMMHHKEPQHIILSGESFSGKSTNANLLISHLTYLGGGNKGATDKVINSSKAIQMLINAGTPLNNNSTRCSMLYYLTFGTTGKMSGAVFIMQMLEKMRVSSTDMNQHNFHILYYFYDYMAEKNKLKEYMLTKNRGDVRYLRIPADIPVLSKLTYPRDDPKGNVAKFEQFEEILKEADITVKNLETIRKMLAAILVIGNIRFRQGDRKSAELEDANIATRVAELLRVDEKKFQWSLINYCKVKGGIAERKQYTSEEARDARDALAAAMYSRLVDWIINKINMNMAFPRAVFGDVNTIVVHDLAGFECFHRNGLEQLMINSLNEQMQYHYNQRIFVSEMMEMEADGIPSISLNFFDNKTTLDNLLTKPDGLFYLIDEATKIGQDPQLITERLQEKKSQFVKVHSNTEISIAHYTGKIIYDIRAFTDMNKDFVAPEMIESLRTSLDESICLMFTNQLTKSGNLTMAFENIEHKKSDDKRRRYPLNTLSLGSVSQVSNARTLSANFRHTCLEMLKILSQTFGLGTHFVRCIRSELEYQPRGFHPQMVQQQLKALGIIDTIIARQQGYSCRISFQEFLKRYQFLAFDFDETVDLTKDNCRLLLVRLKMEGWAIGKSKVFLRYYNDEFLSRLYEVQVKKIIKVQSMMRALISRRKMKQGIRPGGPTAAQGAPGSDADNAATTIQKAYRGFRVRQKYGPLLNEKTGQVDTATASFVQSFAKKWKKKTIFQVLLHYRAARFQDLVNLSQQVHIYNQRIVSIQSKIARSVPLEKVNARENNPSLLGPLPIPARKLPFRLDEIPYYDTTYMCDPFNTAMRSQTSNTVTADYEEPWDAPLQRNPSLTTHLMSYNAYKKEQACQTNWDRMHDSDVVHNQHFNRDPNALRRSATMGFRNDFNYQADYGTQMGDMYGNNYGQNFGRNRPGSRRNSLKNYAAPPPPPMPMNMMRDDASRMNQRNRNYNSQTTYRPPNPVQEMQFMGRRSSMDTSDDDPPFNFKSMLRKTNYSRPETTTEYNSHNDSENNNSFMPKLRPTGRKFDEGNSGMNNRTEPASFNRPNLKPSSKNANSSDSNGRYVEEEIAPGVTLTGYAIDI